MSVLSNNEIQMNDCAVTARAKCARSAPSQLQLKTTYWRSCSESIRVLFSRMNWRGGQPTNRLGASVGTTRHFVIGALIVCSSRSVLYDE